VAARILFVFYECLIDPCEFKHFDVYFLFNLHRSTPALRIINRIPPAYFKVGNAEYLLQFFDLTLEKIFYFLPFDAVARAMTVDTYVRGPAVFADFFFFEPALSRVTALTEVGLGN
jgi:hypothetical protein